MSAAAAVSVPLPLDDTRPVVGAVYIHRTEERLKVGAVAPRIECGWCNGRGRDRACGRCEACDGTGMSPGSVVCYHPEGEPRRALKLIWPLAEFMQQFRRADGFGETGSLFIEAATP